MKLERETVDIAIEVPSGKLAYGNNFMREFQDGVGDFNINELVGKKLTIERYGEVGLLHGFVGNSCPGVYQDGNKIYIGNSGYGKDTDESFDDIPGKEVGSICTDLWWYSVCDYNNYVSRGGDPNTNHLDVEPGRYVLKHKLQYDDSCGKTCIYATIEKSDEPIIKWKMPEEGCIEGVIKYLPKKHLGKKDASLHIKSKYKKIGKGYDWDDYEFVGYKVCGYIKEPHPVIKKIDKKEPEHVQKLQKDLNRSAKAAWVYIIVDEKTLRNHKCVAKLLVENYHNKKRLRKEKDKILRDIDKVDWKRYEEIRNLLFDEDKL